MKTRKEQIQEMLADEPNDSFLRYGLAMEHLSEGDHEGAVGCFRDLIAIDADYVPAYLQGGQALIRLGRPDEARVMLQQGMAAAQKQGNEHAYGEMMGFLESLG